MALTAHDYDSQWAVLTDFIKFNPGARHRRRLIIKMLGNLKISDCLDIGCGKGDLLSLLNAGFQSKIKFTGVDLSPAVIEENTKSYPDIKFYALDIEKEKLSKKFSLITCSEVLEHVINIDFAFKNISSMLLEGGHLLITVPTGKIFGTEKYFGHVNHPTSGEIQELAKKNGMQVINIWNWGFPFYRILKTVTNVNTDWSMKNFGDGSYNSTKKIICNFLYYLNFLNFRSAFGCQLFALLKKHGVSIE